MEKEMSHPCDNQACQSDPSTVPDISIKDLDAEITWESTLSYYGKRRKYIKAHFIKYLLYFLTYHLAIHTCRKL